MSKITEKIAKLLALANSPYEAEAQAALLKARELMAEYKLKPEDVSAAGTKNVVEVLVNVRSTKLSTPWAAQLAEIISKHHCCKYLMRTYRGKKTSDIVLLGFEEDVKLCRMVYCYAFESVRSMCDRIKLHHKYQISAKQVRQLCHSYGWGFCAGLSTAFQAQDAQHKEWGLIMAVPTEVQQSFDKMPGVKFSSYAKPNTDTMDGHYASMGFSDGKKFSTADRLNSANAG